jgi:hypothetical protein
VNPSPFIVEGPGVECSRIYAALVTAGYGYADRVHSDQYDDCKEPSPEIRPTTNYGNSSDLLLGQKSSLWIEISYP